MSAICWGNLLPDPSRLNTLSAEDLDAIERTAECEAMTVGHGIAAIGELLAHTADAGELTEDAARMWCHCPAKPLPSCASSRKSRAINYMDCRASELQEKADALGGAQ